MTSVAGGLVIIFASLFFAFFVVIIMLTWLKSHRLRIRDPLNNKAYVEEYWVTDKKDKKDGIIYWKSVFWQKKIKVIEPPKDAIDIGKKGRKYAEAYRLSSDQFVWITDKGIRVEEDEHGNLSAYDVQEDGSQLKIDSFKPFTATQRQVVVHQFMKADTISKKKWTTAEIMGVVSTGGLVMVILLFLLFGGDLLKEYNSVASTHLATANVQAETTRNLGYMAKAIGVQMEDMDFEVVQNVQSEKGGGIVSDSEEPPNAFDVRDKLGLGAE